MSRVTLISMANARSQPERESIAAQSVPGLVHSVRVFGSPAEVLRIWWNRPWHDDRRSASPL